MKRINLLNADTSNKIAAGEVVERPSSVVKELVENSIDADAKNITIEIECGGSQLIKIMDDGNGIHPEDIQKAFLPHATSKIKDVLDIYSITSLGFRGEALASIASVSKVKLKSKTEEFDGRSINIEGGEILDIVDVGMNKGTTIEVRDLFYNVPARLKFLKSDSREATAINDIVTRIALSHPDIGFKLYSNGKKVLETFGTGNLKDTIRTIYGKTISDNIIQFEGCRDTFTVYGFIGKEEIARKSRTNQSIFVNKRYIKNRTLSTAVENAFRSFATVSKYPMFILFVDIFPEFVDVNIHPTKAEIKFKDDRSIFKTVFDSVHAALAEEVKDSFNIENDFKVEEEEKVEKIAFEGVINSNEVNIPVDFKQSYYNIEPSKEKEVSINEEKNVEKVYKEVLKDNNNKVNYNKAEEKDEAKVNDVIEEEYKEEPILEKKEAKFPPMRIIGQFNKTYIIGQIGKDMILIDQHAAHEKILFEEYMEKVSKSNIVIQPLLVPDVITLNSEDYVIFDENREIFYKSGFTVEDFGSNTVVIKEVPYFLGKSPQKELFLNIIDNLKSMGSGKTTEVKYNKIATMACKAAVKANDELKENEIQELIDKLRYIKDPFHCPHGRPTIIKITLEELDKKFRRIV